MGLVPQNVIFHAYTDMLGEERRNGDTRVHFKCSEPGKYVKGMEDHFVWLQTLTRCYLD